MSPVQTPAPHPRTLLIDDDFISRELLALVLETHGFPIESAADGPEALALIENSPSPYQLILMDTQMPGLSGLDLVLALRAKTQVRIVAISGSPISPALEQATDGFLLKPIAAETLIDLLQGSPQTADTNTAPPTEITETTEANDIIDPTILAKLKAMMPATSVEEIYTAVASDLTTRLDTLKTAIEASNQVQVASIAHSIKGACAMVGLSSARDAATRLETSNTPDTWPKELLQLRQSLIALQSILGGRLL